MTGEQVMFLVKVIGGDHVTVPGEDRSLISFLCYPLRG
jgi:hypothetical protein